MASVPSFPALTSVAGILFESLPLLKSLTGFAALQTCSSVLQIQVLFASASVFSREVCLSLQVEQCAAIDQRFRRTENDLGQLLHRIQQQSAQPAELSRAEDRRRQLGNHGEPSAHQVIACVKMLVLSSALHFAGFLASTPCRRVLVASAAQRFAFTFFAIASSTCVHSLVFILCLAV